MCVNAELCAIICCCITVCNLFRSKLKCLIVSSVCYNDHTLRTVIVCATCFKVVTLVAVVITQACFACACSCVCRRRVFRKAVTCKLGVDIDFHAFNRRFVCIYCGCAVTCNTCWNCQFVLCIFFKTSELKSIGRATLYYTCCADNCTLYSRTVCLCKGYSRSVCNRRCKCQCNLTLKS